MAAVDGQETERPEMVGTKVLPVVQDVTVMVFSNSF
jgi:hypothetical protein